MNFKQRLLRYVLGLGIGLLLVWAMFGNRSWLGWTPGQRLLRDMREMKLAKTEKAQCQMDCIGISDQAIKTLLVEGKVDFDQSSTRTSPKVYVIKSKELNSSFEVSDSTATLVQVVLAESNQECPCP